MLTTPGAPSLSSAPPAEFGGPGDQWSPETLFVAAVVDCYLLTFRAIARASNLSWTKLACRGEGVLDRVDGITRFTTMGLSVHLTVAPGTDPERAQRLLVKAERDCLITNSLACRPSLTAEVRAA